MDLTILIITILLLLETSVILIRTAKKPLINSSSKRKIYVDTSALMDPRLLKISETGFLGDDFIVPRSVTHELQLLADGKDHEKRNRARAGLETVRALERVVHFNTSILDDELDRTPVDNRLLELARDNHGLILTNDYNLQKVAETEHIDVLNINELALALRTEFLPGERTHIRIASVGNNPHQGVGYLDGGTMVIVDNAEKRVGQEVDIEFTRLNQTASGTLLFAKILPPKSRKNSK